MKLKNIRLSLSNVNVTSSRKDMEVIETAVNRVRMEDGTMGKDVANYVLKCLANKADILNVKVGKEYASKITEIHDALNSEKIVTVVFEGLRLKPYAMIGNDGKLYAGVSGTAENFTFSIQEPEDDFGEIEI